MRRSASLLGLSCLVAACGGATGGSQAPSTGASKAEATYATIDDAERDLSRAERELATVTPGRPAAELDRREPPGDATAGQKGGLTPAQPAAPPPPPAPPQAAPKNSDDAGKAVQTEERAPRAPTPCETACRALASMARAADAICRMAGDTDARCTSARQRVDESTTRAATCHCAR